MIDDEIFQLNIARAMHRIEDLYFQTFGKCYLSYSGGKDSTVVLALIKMCEDIGVIPKNETAAVFCDTKIELGVTYDFIKWVQANWYENVVILEPEKPFTQIMKENGKPIKSKMRSELLDRYQKNPQLKSTKMLLNKGYRKTALANKDFHLIHPAIGIRFSQACCSYLKKKPFMRYVKENQMEGYLSGERLAEGGARSVQIQKRINEGKPICTKISGDYITKQPIVDWTDEMIEKFITVYNVPLSKAYTEYHMTRTGCCCCPFSKNIANDLEILFNYEPNKYKAAMFWLKDVYIAQNVILPFDSTYEAERLEMWETKYEAMRYEMLKQYRPDCQIVKKYEGKKLSC